MVGLRDPEWLQGALNVPIGIFLRYGMIENIAKSKAMICHTGALRYRMLEEPVGRR